VPGGIRSEDELEVAATVDAALVTDSALLFAHLRFLDDDWLLMKISLLFKRCNFFIFLTGQGQAPGGHAVRPEWQPTISVTAWVSPSPPGRVPT
jgi:hypothetical protein